MTNKKSKTFSPFPPLTGEMKQLGEELLKYEAQDGKPATTEQIVQMYNVLREAQARQNKKRRIVKLRHALAIAAIIAILTSLVLSVEAFRLSFFSFFHIETSESTVYGFTHEDREGQRYAPHEIPDIGFIQQLYVEDPITRTIHAYYDTPDRGEYINIYIYMDGQQSNADSEDIDASDPININDYKGTVTEKDDRVTIVWSVPEVAATGHLYTSLPVSDAKKVAESICFE